MITPRTPLPKLIFSIFVSICDGNRAISARDAERFGQLMVNTRWATHRITRDALDVLRAQYPVLWAEYEQQNEPIAVVAIEHEWCTCRATLPQESVAEIQKDLASFTKRLCAIRPWNDNGPGSRGDVTDRIEAMLNKPDPLDAKTAPRYEPGSAERPSALDPPAPKPPTTPQEGSDASTWTGGRLQVRCVGVVPEAPDVKTYSFAATDRRRFGYKPGQAVTIEVEIDGRTVRRSYTISSSPSRPNVLSITVKRVPQGEVSGWLYDTMAIGVELHLTGPHGKLSCLDHPSDKLLLIAGGSGVTPMMSMLRYLSDTCAASDIVFINNVRTPLDIIFASELNHLSARLGPALRMAIVPSALTGGVSWSGPIGRFSATLLHALAPDFAEREIFVCGPPPYMASIRALLEHLAFPMARHHEESFGPAKPLATPPAEPTPGSLTPELAAEAIERSRRAATGMAPNRQGSAQKGMRKWKDLTGRATPETTAPSPAVMPPQIQTVVSGGLFSAGDARAPRPAAIVPNREEAPLQVVFQRSGVTVSCDSKDLLLDVAERHGVTLNSSCRAGACGTCKVRKLKGTVSMDEQFALSEDEIADGDILACTAHVLSSLVVDV